MLIAFPLASPCPPSSWRAAFGRLVREKKRRQAFTPRRFPGEVATATRGDVRETLHALGTVDAEEQVKVTVEIDGIVRALPFEEGRLVRKGQVLAILNDTELRAEVRRAAALRDQARLTWERFEQLSKEQIDRRRIATTRARRSRREANLGLAQPSLEDARARDVLRRVEAGSSPRRVPARGGRITEIARIDTVKGVLRCRSATWPTSAGSGVTVTTVVFPGRSSRGVNVLDPILDAATGRAAFRRDPETPGVSSGRACPPTSRRDRERCRRDGPGRSGVRGGDRNFVFVVQPDSTVVRRPVKLGARQPGRVEIREGLQGGEKVVRAGHQKLYEGAKVSPVEAAAAPAAPAAAGATSP